MDEHRELHLFDLKTPLGGLLLFYGVVLVAYGVWGDAANSERSLGININLWWGFVMVVVGAVFFRSGRRAEKREG